VGTAAQLVAQPVRQAGGFGLTDNGGMAKPIPRLSPDQIQRIIATAWDDTPPFNAVLMQHGISQGELVQLLKRELTPNAFKLWRARTGGGKPNAPMKRKPRGK